VDDEDELERRNLRSMIGCNQAVSYDTLLQVDWTNWTGLLRLHEYPGMAVALVLTLLREAYYTMFRNDEMHTKAHLVYASRTSPGN